MIKFTTLSPEQTFAIGQKLAQCINNGLTICLEGDLGAGKTLFVQGLADGLEIDDEVTSPTFSLMNVYSGKYTMYHFDLYRLDNAEELEDIGFYEYASLADDVVVIEWADKFVDCLPDDYLRMVISRGTDENERDFSINLVGSRYQAVYEELNNFANFSN